MHPAFRKENARGDFVQVEAKLGPGSSVWSVVDDLVLEKAGASVESRMRSVLGCLLWIREVGNSLGTPSKIHVGAVVWMQAMCDAGTRDKAQVSFQTVDLGLLAWAEARCLAREHIFVFRRKSFCDVELA